MRNKYLFNNLKVNEILQKRLKTLLFKEILMSKDTFNQLENSNTAFYLKNPF